MEACYTLVVPLDLRRLIQRILRSCNLLQRIRDSLVSSIRSDIGILLRMTGLPYIACGHMSKPGATFCSAGQPSACGSYTCMKHQAACTVNLVELKRRRLAGYREAAAAWSQAATVHFQSLWPYTKNTSFQQLFLVQSFSQFRRVSAAEVLAAEVVRLVKSTEWRPPKWQWW